MRRTTPGFRLRLEVRPRLTDHTQAAMPMRTIGLDVCAWSLGDIVSCDRNKTMKTSDLTFVREISLDNERRMFEGKEG